MRNTPPSSPRRVRSAHESRSAAVRAAAAAPSRRQLSRWQREQHQQRWLFIAIGVLVVLVVGVLAGGVIFDNVVRANDVVAQVGPDSITAAQLVDQMRPAARSIDAQAKQIGSSANIQQYADQQKRSLPDQTLNTLMDRRIVEQEAARRGISVAQTEIDDRQRQTVADFTAATNPTPVPTADASPGASVAGTPTTAPTLEGDAYTSGLQKLLERNGLTESDVRDQLKQTLLREKLQAAIGADQVPDVQEQVHARHILLTTEDQARAVLQPLQAGADFTQLAQDQSTDPGSKAAGGDLGWFPRGVMDKAFEDAAFALQPGQLSDVVHGTNGYHVIQVLERDPARAVPADQLTSSRSKAFGTWLDSRRTSPDVKLQLSTSTRDWALARIGVRP